MQLIARGPGVYNAPHPVSTIGGAELAFVCEAARTSPRGRARINLHFNDADPVHEMFIALTRESYVRPHRHLLKSEAFHLVSGALRVVLFDDDGTIARIIPLAENAAQGARYYRLSAPVYHTLIIDAPEVVIHEITSGPFDATGTEFAPFAPTEGALNDARAYCEQLRTACDASAATPTQPG